MRFTGDRVQLETDMSYWMYGLGLRPAWSSASIASEGTISMAALDRLKAEDQDRDTVARYGWLPGITAKITR